MRFLGPTMTTPAGSEVVPVRLTRAALNTAASNTALASSQIYFLTDEDRVVFAKTKGAYVALARQDEVPTTTLKAAVYVTATGTGLSQNITIPAGFIERDLVVTINGIEQDPATDYTISGTTLTIVAYVNSKIRIRNQGGTTGAKGDTGTAGNMSGSNNLSELTDKALAQFNLGLRYATVAEARAGTADRILTAATVQAMGQTVALTPGAALDLSAFRTGSMTLTANAALPNPAALTPYIGHTFIISVTQGGAGGFKLTPGDQYYTVDGAKPSFSTTPGAIDRIYLTVTSSTTIDMLVVKNLLPISPYGEESTLAFAAMSTQPTAARKKLYDDFIEGLKTDGVWAMLDNLFLWAAHDGQASRVNLKRPGVVAQILNNPGFTVDRGWRAAQGSTHGLTTNEMLYGSSLNAKSTISSFFGFWLNSILNGSGQRTSYFDLMDANSYNGISIDTGGIFAKYASYEVLNANASPTNGMYTVTKPSASAGDVLFIKDTTTYTTIAGVGQYDSSTNWVALNKGPAANYNSSTNNQQAAMFSGGPGLTAAMTAKLYGRLQTYLAAIGAA